MQATPDLKALSQELSDALQEHDRTYPAGNWKAANDRIGEARKQAGKALFRAGAVPSPVHLPGNDELLKMLSAYTLAPREPAVR